MIENAIVIAMVLLAALYLARRLGLKRGPRKAEDASPGCPGCSGHCELTGAGKAPLYPSPTCESAGEGNPTPRSNLAEN